MTIVIVEDNYINETDGTSISAHRFRHELIKRGHTVRVIGIGIKGQDMYGVKEHYVPLVTEVARYQNMHFAKFDKKIVAKAFEGADIIHLTFPWQMEQRCYALAKKMGIPVSGAFHCQPENVTYNIKLKLLRFVNTFLYFLFRTWLYGRIENIHCPSLLIARELVRHKYTARLHVFSNGILERFTPPYATVPKEPDTIRILMTGRLAEEKRQDLIIKAVQHSKYKDKIQLHFIGRGPMYKRYHRYGLKLPKPPIFEPEFVPQEKMPEQIYKADIYVHASEAEIEGIACIEAIACGKVPIIADSKLSAAPQFALDERSLFKNKNFLDLRDKIDYWIEHPQEREEMGKKYAKMAEKYNISYSVLKMEKMFKDAIRDFKTAKMIKEDKKLKKYYRLVNRKNKVEDFFSRLLYFGFVIPILSIFLRCWFGLKIKNRRVLKKIKGIGAVAICNHIHELDSPICGVGVPLRKFTVVSNPDNFDLKVAGFFVNALGSVPTPATPKELQVFIYALSKKLRQRQLVLFFPEGHRLNYNENLQDFHRGAFYLAVDANAPIIPMKIETRKPDGLLRFIRKKPCFTLVFNDPLYPKESLSKNDAVNDLKERAEMVMR